MLPRLLQRLVELETESSPLLLAFLPRLLSGCSRIQSAVCAAGCRKRWEKKKREREAPKSEKQTFTTRKSTNPNIQTQIVTFVTWPGHCSISTRGCEAFYIGPITVDSKINVLEEDNGCIRKLARVASPVSFLWAEANKATKAYGNKGAWHGKQCLQQGETWKVKAWHG